MLKTKCPLVTGANAQEKREEIRSYFEKTFWLDETIYECLNREEAFYQKAIPLRHPLIFYYGHTATFFINKLFSSGLIPHRIDEELEAMFAVGVDEMSWDDLDDSNFTWPPLAKLREYRKQVRQVVNRAISELPLSLPIRWEDPFWIILMAIEHTRIHIETSSVLIRQLPIQWVRPSPELVECQLTGEAPINELLPVPGGEISLGKCTENPIYGWDNEYGQLKCKLDEFKASRFLVSNGEFFSFVEAAGYHDFQLWTEEGKSWLQYTKANHPSFWVRDESAAEGSLSPQDFRYRTITRVIPMPWDWPVDVNYFEAKAFCNWKTKKTARATRLPTEAEWMMMRNLLPADQPYWEKAPGNINLEHWASACPVNHFAFPGGFYDLIGNVWQWTETPIEALPGFRVHKAYDDFSIPTFDNKHNLINGGSFISTGNCATKDARYAFRRHFFQHAGFRYVEAASYDTQATSSNPYETDQLVSQYIEFHYGSEYLGTANFPKSCAEICLQEMKDKPRRRALDLGCATGRASFELAKEFEQVEGLDFSTRFIRVASSLQAGEIVRYTIPTEGDLTDARQVSLRDLALDGNAHRCQFWQADACNLPAKFTGYDLVLAANLIDRLYAPEKFLESIASRINTGGLLVMTSPYTWLAEYTPREHWIGGFKEQGREIQTLEGLTRKMAAQFRLVGTARDVPFVIRETARKYQHTFAQLTVWEKT